MTQRMAVVRLPEKQAPLADALRAEADQLDTTDSPAWFDDPRQGKTECLAAEQALRHAAELTEGASPQPSATDGATAPARLIRVYVAGPYTHGDVAQNVAAAMRAADELIEAGFAPFVPHLSHFQHLAHARPYHVWTALDFSWLAVCDAAVRLPGLSPGADAEIKWCLLHRVPVFASIQDLIAVMRGRAIP